MVFFLLRRNKPDDDTREEDLRQCQVEMVGQQNGYDNLDEQRAQENGAGAPPLRAVDPSAHGGARRARTGPTHDDDGAPKPSANMVVVRGCSLHRPPFVALRTRTPPVFSVGAWR